MPQMFTFGIPNYFQFTFRRGPKTPVSLQSFGGGTSSPCGTLGKLPLELRTMVYRKVLRYEKWCIQEAQEFMDRHPPIMAGEAPYLEDNDAFLLRTCRTVYQEAVHILYGGNAFSFSKPEDIEKFAHFGMGNTPFGYYRTASESPSAVGDAPYGRLTMIRSLDLMFNGAQSTSWSSWCNFFYPPEKQPQSIGFPALERLCLDFSDWGLRAEDASKIRVKAFLRKLRPTGGLRSLTLIGVNHEQNLREFKHGFVKEGGTFRPASITDNTVPTTTVTHDDLPEISMWVRAIVEKDRASRAINSSK